ncbi:MAG TPA: universal stress protein [Solirubrobacteraceae bacterium]|nr:universal stress protein [Solirubrobacteraceae bacterium]
MSATSGPVIVGVGDEPYADDAVALGTELGELLDAAVEHVAVPGHDPAAVLRDAAAHDRAAMIVLGPSHHHLLRTLRGTARHLLVGAECPVAVAPAGYAQAAHGGLRRIGVGFEPTPVATRALDFAYGLATRAAGSLIVVGVALPLAPFATDDVRDTTPYLDEERKTVQRGLEREIARLPAEVPCRAEARIGSPAGELAEVSRDSICSSVVRAAAARCVRRRSARSPSACCGSRRALS